MPAPRSRFPPRLVLAGLAKSASDAQSASSNCLRRTLSPTWTGVAAWHTTTSVTRAGKRRRRLKLLQATSCQGYCRRRYVTSVCRPGHDGAVTDKTTTNIRSTTPIRFDYGQKIPVLRAQCLAIYSLGVQRHPHLVALSPLTYWSPLFRKTRSGLI
jgi:hypothetical protein